MMTKRVLMLSLMLLSARVAYADVITLEDANSTFSVDAHSQAGAFSWQVDGTEHLFTEWFWYRAGFMSRERSIEQKSTGASSFVSHTATDTDADGGYDKLVIAYDHSNQGFALEVEYNLFGGPANGGASTLTERITITNVRSAGNLAFNLYEYSDFNVNGTADNDTATLVDPSTVEQTDPLGAAVTVTVTQPPPSAYEIAAVPTTLAKLNDNSKTDLSNTSPVVGPDDVAFAFQWKEIISPGSTFVISKEKQILGSITTIPEPASFMLFGPGLLALRYWRRQRHKRGSTCA